MKKIAILFVALAALAGGAFAQTAIGSLSLGYSVDSYTVAGGVTENYSSIQLNFGSFTGDTLGVYFAASIGAPVAYSVTDTYGVTEDYTTDYLDWYYDDMRLSSTSVVALALNLDIGPLNIMGGAGAGYSLVLATSTSYSVAPVLNWWVGPAAYAQAGLKLGDNASLFVSATLIVGMVDLMDGMTVSPWYSVSSTTAYESAVTFMPAIGFSYSM